jgi:hypothetical protein
MEQFKDRFDQAGLGQTISLQDLETQFAGAVAGVRRA